MTSNERNKVLALFFILYVWPTICLSMAGVIAVGGFEDASEAVLMAAIIGLIQLAGSLGFTAIYLSIKKKSDSNKGADIECK